MSFDFAPSLADDVMALTPLGAGDYEGLFRAASDPGIWEQHPQVDRYKEDVFRPYFDFLLQSGGTLVARDQAAGDVIGCSRFYESDDAPGDICIGFTFLTRAHWGGLSNGRMKALMLAHAFKRFDAVWFHIGADNLRSQKATMKLGAVYMREVRGVGGTGDHPHKLVHQCECQAA